MLKLYSIFHLNLMYSSIPEESRAEVIKVCYWPMLELARQGYPIGVEASGYTIEVIQALDPRWIEEIKALIKSKKVEFIGSGYAQLIEPIVPALVNKWNFEFGRDVYKHILKTEPEIWYINEQAYSKSLVGHYLNIGAKAFVMEWNNPRSLHNNWQNAYRFFPQMILGNTDKLPVIWNDSITFQKFQRFAHGELTERELLDYYENLTIENGFHCLYGNDVETFNFRPGRFHTEVKIKHDEWKRIFNLYLAIKKNKNLDFCLPSEVLKTNNKNAFNELKLETSAVPIPVKKQPKYNVTRWALTGRDNIGINSICYEIYKALKEQKKVEDSFKKELCYCWSSDFRTHITEKRWKSFQNKLRDLKNKVVKNNFLKMPKSIKVISLKGKYKEYSEKQKSLVLIENNSHFYNEINHRLLKIKTESVELVFNKLKGFSIDSLAFPKICSDPLIGTIPHGYYTDIALGADWYTANTVLRQPGKPQITDLHEVEKISFQQSQNEKMLIVKTAIPTPIGLVKKSISIHKDLPQIDIELVFDWNEIPLSSFKTGYITFLPEAFDVSTMFYATHNGGENFEIFPLLNHQVDHDLASSSIVSASHGLGATEGQIVVGDKKKGVGVVFDQAVCAVMPMLKHLMTSDNNLFSRLMFSYGEIDESVKVKSINKTFSFSIIGFI